MILLLSVALYISLGFDLAYKTSIPWYYAVGVWPFFMVVETYKFIHNTYLKKEKTEVLPQMTDIPVEITEENYRKFLEADIEIVKLGDQHYVRKDKVVKMLEQYAEHRIAKLKENEPMP